MQGKEGNGKECDKDINNVFDELLFSEENLIEQGYQEGITKGVSEGNTEGYHLGYHRGAEIGSELGYYLGVVEFYLQQSDKKTYPEKLLSLMTKLKKLIEDFPKVNVEHVDIINEVENIRTLYKKFVALSKSTLSYPEIDKLSF